MDPVILGGVVYGVIAIVIAGGLLFMSRPKSPVAPGTGAWSVTGYVPTISSFQRWGRIAGIVIPFAVLAVGPLMDVYYNKFQYTTISLVGIFAMVFGFLYQAIIHGTSAYLSTLTIGTAATLTYVLLDLWVQADGYSFKVISTVLGALLMFLQLIHTVSGPVFSSSLLNDGIGLLLGSGLGALSFAIVYNTKRDYLPFTNSAKQPEKTAKK
jgi:hypothetical protein